MMRLSCIFLLNCYNLDAKISLVKQTNHSTLLNSLLNFYVVILT